MRLYTLALSKPAEREASKKGLFLTLGPIAKEMGMLINTLKFSEDIGNGLCIQVSQGADTDSYGATAGSILGSYYGPGYLDKKWLDPFNNDLRTGMAHFYERSVVSVAERMGKLPQSIMN